MEGIRATREEIRRFLSIQGCSGCGSGYGYGCSYGSGYSYGCGYGSGYSYSCDSGNGSGNGFGCGSEDGCGFGIGYGIGYGDGYFIGYGGGFSIGIGDEFGEGFGRDEEEEDDDDDEDCDNNDCCYTFSNDDIVALNGNIVDYIDRVPTIITQVHGNTACGYIVKEDLTLDSCFIAKVGNSFAHGKTIKDAVTDAVEKDMERIPIEERIKKFIEVFGPLDTEHDGKEFYNWHHILTGSCRMGRDEFCKSHNIDLTQKYSVRYFLDITKGSYGSNIIKLIEKAYKEIEG